MMRIIVALMMVFTLPASACAAGGMGGCGMGGHEGHSSATHNSHTEAAVAPETGRLSPDPNFDAAKTRRVLDAYDQIVVVLAADQVAGMGEPAALIAKDAPSEAIRKAAEPLAQARDKQDVAGAREQFKVLSAAVVPYVAANRVSLEASLQKDNAAMPRKAYCQMAQAAWLQRGDKITNPYYGTSMLRCGVYQEWEVVVNNTAGTNGSAAAAEYVCPMHPEIRRDQPGNCPRCGMTLKLVTKETSEHQH